MCNFFKCSKCFVGKFNFRWITGIQNENVSAKGQYRVSIKQYWYLKLKYFLGDEIHKQNIFDCRIKVCFNLGNIM